MQIFRQEELVTKEALTLVSESDLKTIGLPLGSIQVLLQEVKLWKSENSQPELQWNLPLLDQSAGISSRCIPDCDL